MTHAERRVILTLLALGVAGQGVQVLRGGGPSGPAPSLAAGRRGTPATHRDSSALVDRPLAPGERIDPNRATALDLARLPGVGMRLAKEIVRDREIRGSFGSLADLDRVEGIGPGLLRRLEPFLLSPPRNPNAPDRLDLNSATQEELERLPGVGPARARAILAYRDRDGPFAEPMDLDRVPGIGPGLARRLAALVRTR